MRKDCVRTMSNKGEKAVDFQFGGDWKGSKPEMMFGRGAVEERVGGWRGRACGVVSAKQGQ